jgi:hypothetical protein
MANPGWYPNPDGSESLRYWDGSRWSDHYSGQQAPAPPPTEHASRVVTPPIRSASAAEQVSSSSPGLPTGFRTRHQDARPSHRFIGDAELGSYWTVRQIIDAICYVVSGIVLIVIAAQPEGADWAALLGIGAILYGLRIVAMGGTYWVSYWIYVVTLFVIVYMLGLLG